MPKTTKSKIAAELLAELRQNPGFSAREKLRDEQNERIEDSSRDEQIQLLSELKDIGILVESVWDLVNGKQNYSVAIPILIRRLSTPQSRPFRKLLITSKSEIPSAAFSLLS